MIKYELVQTNTPDNFNLSGLYNEGNKEKEAVIHIHGFTSDIYSHKFPLTIAEKLQEQNNAIILAQNRGTGLYTEIIKSNRKDCEYLGSFYEKLEEAHLDITGWIKFLKEQGYTKIALMGHSLGTIKIVRYLFEGEFKDDVTKLILLAPFDKNGGIENYTKGKWHEHIEIAKNKIEQGHELEIIPDTFDEFEMTYRTYYSWYQETDLNQIWDFYRKDYISPVLKQINIPVKVIIGDIDVGINIPELGVEPNMVKDKLEASIENVEVVFIKDSVHEYIDHEEEVAYEVFNFVS